jgi:DNA-binding NarL/FixJ family response regulator
MSESLRVLVADDHPLFRQGLGAALDPRPFALHSSWNRMSS